MKFTIMGFSQEEAINLGLDILDLSILRWLLDFNPNMQKKIINGVEFGWVVYKKILADYPILKMSKSTLQRRINHLQDIGLLEKHCEKVQGTFLYVRLLPKMDNLISKNDIGGSSNWNEGYVKMTHPVIQNDTPGMSICYNKDYSIINKSIKDKSIKNNISLLEKKEDLFLNNTIDTFIKQAKEILNQNVYLLKEHREKILELNRAIDNFEEITPEVLRKLKTLKFDFGGRTTKPNIDWLLKDTNFIKLLNDELPQVAPAAENNEPEEIWSINDYMNKKGF